MKFIFVLSICFFSFFVQGQNSDSQLAYTYYQNKEYDKAAQVFLQLYERTHSANFLDYHIISLINGKQYEKAEETLKKFLKTDPKNKDFLINLGYIYQQQGKTKKSEENYEKAIKILIPNSSDINSLAYKFRNIREYDWAIKTYLRGQELLKKPDAFLNELGENYMMARNYERMLFYFFKILANKPAEINNITSKLSFARSYDIINNVDGVLEQKLNEIFKQKDYLSAFNELAVWYTLQKKEYKNALQHAILLNQKSQGKLYIFLNIGRYAADVKEFDIAITAFNQVVKKGKEKNQYYTAARQGLLTSQFGKAQQEKASPSTYQSLVHACRQYLQEYGYSSESTEIALMQSDIFAYQLNQPDSANLILEKCTEIRRLPTSSLNLIKFKRADLLAFTHNPWEATILYTQLEKANPNNEIGYEAKLKKAWLAYYAGDLLWAKAQFDALKGSTTKLISNDAIQMSHFINMNYEENGNNKELTQLAHTEYLIYRQKYRDALTSLDSLILHSQPAIADHATLQKVRILCQDHNYTQAVNLLQNLREKSGQTYIQAEAIFTLAKVKKQLQEYTQAQELCKTLVSEYSGSVYSVEAAHLYREIEQRLKLTIKN